MALCVLAPSTALKNVVTNQVEQLYAPAAMRVAEGGMEHIRILETESTESL